jgi:hypothetical protein
MCTGSYLVTSLQILAKTSSAIFFCPVALKWSPSGQHFLCSFAGMLLKTG